MVHKAPGTQIPTHIIFLYLAYRREDDTVGIGLSPNVINTSRVYTISRIEILFRQLNIYDESGLLRLKANDRYYSSTDYTSMLILYEKFVKKKTQ